MKVVKKHFIDCVKEETWLNEMSAKGFALIGCTGHKYVFTESQPGEYIYRIELLNRDPNHPASLEYLQFIKGTDIEHIASDLNWIYLRKKSVDGAFEIYSDIDSRIKHYQKANRVPAIVGFGLALLSLLCVCVTLVALYRGISLYRGMIAVVVMALLIISTGFVGVGVLKMHWNPLRKKMKELKKDKMIME